MYVFNACFADVYTHAHHVSMHHACVCICVCENVQHIHILCVREREIEGLEYSIHNARVHTHTHTHTHTESLLAMHSPGFQAGDGPYGRGSMGGVGGTTSAPTTSAPMTSAPTTSAPTTSAPTTSAPTTSAPKTSAPTTSAPAALRVPEHSANGLQPPNAPRREQVLASTEGSNALPKEGPAQNDKELPPNWMAVPSISRPGP